tara:strand:- start:85 stop:648 length:564 start_codon:yes stop_codon:yes gene_type:complete
MSINITVGSRTGPSPKVGKDSSEKGGGISLELDMRRSLDGNIMIFDHSDIDIVMFPGQGKIVAFPKDTMQDLVYGAQDRLFSYLSKKGIVDRDSIRGGSVYGSLEATALQSVDLDTTRMALINISKWIDEERPYFEFVEKYEEMSNDRFTDPNEEESTELGEVPHSENKGTLRPGYNYGPYWQSFTY